MGWLNALAAAYASCLSPSDGESVSGRTGHRRAQAATTARAGEGLIDGRPAPLEITFENRSIVWVDPPGAAREGMWRPATEK